MIVCTDRGGIHAGHQGRATRGAHRGGGKTAREPHPARGERIETRCGDFFRPVSEPDGRRAPPPARLLAWNLRGMG
jgi:hypothetical protein